MLRISSIILLLFNGIGAVYGGLLLIVDPSGTSIGLPLDLLGNSPFPNYFIPGLVLFIVNGLCSLITVGLAAYKWNHFPKAIFFQGMALITWLMVQLIVIKYIYFLHYVMGSVGILLIVFGLLEHKKQMKKQYDEK